MKNQEKKYRVDSFEEILKLLDQKGATRGKQKSSTHYYAEVEGNDVVKLVSKLDKNEIHVLKETNGKFDLVENIPVENVETGMEWLKNKGYKRVGKVKMVHVDYEYKNGLIGLYTINDWLKSVILDYPAGEHEKMEKEFRLESAEIIKLPYNKYLEVAGKLQEKEI